MRQFAALTMTAFIVAAAPTVEQSKIPAEWKWRIEGTGTVTDAAEPKAGDMSFVTMAPGWHVTTGPAALLYHPAYPTKNTDNFAVETEIFLFPGTSQEEYGIFIAGKTLGPQERPSYLSFLARRDGQGMIRRGGGEPAVDWKVNDGIVPQSGTQNAKNILRVEAGPTDIVFLANGKEVARTSRERTDLSGHFGLRIGKDLNMHVSRLDVTHKLAPVPVKK